MTTINTNTFTIANIIMNLTPHEINFVTDTGERVLDVPASGKIARVNVQTSVVGAVAGIPVTQNFYGEVVNLPEPQANTIYVVSLPVAQRVPDRPDVFIPNELVRDEKGVILGCKSLCHI
jgi:hypothetical protein